MALVGIGVRALAILVLVGLGMVLIDVAITVLLPGWRPGLCGRDCYPPL